LEEEKEAGGEDADGGGGPWLDRATKLRDNEGALKELENHNAAKTVVLRGRADALFSSTTSLGFLPSSAIPTSLPKTFLGRDPMTKSPFFSVTIANDTTLDEIPPDYAFRNSRANAPLLPPHENEILLTAAAFSNFRASHSYCPRCGNPLSAGDAANTTLACAACQSKLFPRLDPSIIVLVTSPCQSKALLTRPYRRPPRYHTAIAGFVEPGETIEAAVCRETLEETGVTVDVSSVRYVGSQSWPFPQSLMLGFRATATGMAIDVDEDELAGAAWFEKAVVERSGAVVDLERRSVLDEEVARKVLEREEDLDVLIPPQGVLARRLIDDWLQQR
jgi:NAD+ diphosphatase